MPAFDRLPDWQARLAAYVASHQRTPFADGRNDCATFAAGAVEAMTGRDPMHAWRGYDLIADGLRDLRAAGFKDHIAFAASLFNEIHPAHAHVGDLAVIRGDEGLALAVFAGEFVLHPGPRGLLRFPRLSARRAFRV